MAKLDVKFDVKYVLNWLHKHIAPMSSETLGWLAVVFIHAATIPSLLALATGLSDDTPPVDLVLLLWIGLTAFFAQACVNRNMLQIITIAIGFIMQTVLMALIFFK